MKNFNFFRVLLPLLLILPLSVQAAWKVTPAAQIQGSYEDNVRMGTQNEDSAFITTATAQLKLNNITENSQVSITGGLSFLKFSGADDLDDRDIEFLDFSVKKRMERASIGIKGSYRRDLMLRRSRAIPGAPGAPIDGAIDDDLNTGDLIDTPDLDDSTSRLQIRRERIRISPTLNWQISERTNGIIRLSYSELNYGDNAIIAGVQGNKSQGAIFSIRHRLSDNDNLTIQASARNFDPDSNTKSQNYQANLVWGHRYTERSRIDLRAGVRRTERDATATQPSTSDTGFVFRISGSRSYERMNLRLSAERSVYPGAFGRLVETDRLTLGLDRRLSARTNWNVNARAYSTDTSGTANSSRQDRDYFQFGTTLARRLNEVLNVNVSYVYTWIDRTQDSNVIGAQSGTAKGNSISLAFSYSPRR